VQSGHGFGDIPAGARAWGQKRMSKKQIYRVVFLNQGQVYELYANQVGQGNMLGFIEVESIIFGERSQVVVDPAEERLKTEFEGVKRTYIPMHAVIRIDEVEKPGPVRISKAEGNISPFPPPGYGPGGGKR